MKKLLNILAAFGIIGGLLLGSAALQAFASTATFRVVQTPTLTLYSSISASATSMRITPYPKDLDGVKLTMTDFGSSTTITIDPKVRNIEEIIGFTNIVDNGDNTATLTGLTRDLASKYPYTTSGTGRQHAASAVAVFSNNPQLYGRLAAPENTQTWTAIQTFASTSQPTLDADLASWIGKAAATLATKGYVDSVVTGGAANADNNTKGISQRAYGEQLASSTALGSTGAVLFIGANLASSSPWSGATTTVVITRNNHTINPNFIATSSADTYNFGGAISFSGAGTTTVSGTGGFLNTASTTLTATTSIAASDVNAKPLKLNGVAYAFPSSQGAAGTTFINNGSGVLTSGNPPGSKYSYASTSASTIANGNTVTSRSLGIPASTLTASSTVTIDADITCNDAGSSGGTCDVSVVDANANTYASFSLTPGSGFSCKLPFHVVIISNNSLSAQATMLTGGCYSNSSWKNVSTMQTTAVNWANAVGLSLKVLNNVGAGSAVSTNGFIITVNP